MARHQRARRPRTLAGWFLGLLVVLLPFTCNAKPGVPFDLAFNEIERQVMFAPEASLQVLSRDPPGTLRSTRLDTYPVLKPGLLPPSDAHCHAFDDEGAGWDVERCRFWRGGWQVDTATTELMMAVVFRRESLSGSPEAAAERVLEAVLAEGAALELSVDGTHEGLTFGRVTTGLARLLSASEMPLFPDVQPKWWHRDAEVGILFPTPDIYGRDLPRWSASSDWFERR